MAIQSLIGLYRFDLCQDRGNALVIACQRNAFAATDVFAITNRQNDGLRFSAAAPRNTKRLPERPDFLVSVDGQRTVRHRRNEDNDETQDYKTAGQRATGPLISGLCSVASGLLLKKNVTSARFRH